MAETLAEKLKRLAAEKKAAAAAPAVKVVETVVANVQPEIVKVEENSDGQNILSGMQGHELGTALHKTSESSSTEGDRQPAQEVIAVETNGVVCSVDVAGNDLQPTPSNHPLKMQFLEMEQALLQADPTFKTILRDVHRHLGKDPDLVTMMTEDEVALVVRGLVHFANAEIVAPAKAKAIKAAGKKVISADDL